MQITEIRGEFRKTVSDGNYGNETYSITLTATTGEGESPTQVALDLADRARAVVEQRLRTSNDRNIRRAVMTNKEREADYDAEREEQRREWEERETKRKADQAARLAAEPTAQPLEDTPF